MEDAALRRDRGVAGQDLHVERVGHGGADIEQRAAGRQHLELFAVERAVASQGEGGPAGIAAFVGVDRAGKLQFALQVDDGQLAVIDDEVLDRRQFGRFAGILAVAEVPIGAAGLVGIEVDDGMVDLQARQDDAADEQGHQFGGDVDRADLGQILLRRPVGLADDQPAHRGVGREAEQMNAQMAVDTGRAVDAAGYDRAGYAARPVPVGIGEEQDDGDHDHDHGADDDLGRSRQVADAGPHADPQVFQPRPCLVRPQGGVVLKLGQGVGQDLRMAEMGFLDHDCLPSARRQGRAGGR